MTKTKPGPSAYETPAKTCEYCSAIYERKRIGLKLEDIRYYMNRRYCSQPCFVAALKKRAKENYEINKDAIRAKKREAMKRLRLLNPEKHNRQSRESQARERALLFAIYGHSCVRCNFTDKRALTLDHINNDGNVERAELGERGVYKKAKALHQPERYQILCMNCQFIKRTEDRCTNQHRPSVLQQHGECLEAQ